MKKIKGKPKSDDVLEYCVALEIQTWSNQQGVKNDFSNDRPLELELTSVMVHCQRMHGFGHWWLSLILHISSETCN